MSGTRSAGIFPAVSRASPFHSWLPICYFCNSSVPVVELWRPVKEICRTIQDLARSGHEAGYFRAALPSMVYYLRRPVFKEYDADSMVRRFQSGKRMFCVLTEKDYNYFVGTRDLIFYVLDRRPGLVIKLRALLNENDRAEQELLPVSNKANLEAGANEDRQSP